MSSRNIKVAIKARPILKKEKDLKLSSQWKIVDNSIRQIESQSDPFFFDHIFDQEITNHTTFDTVVRPIVSAALKGFNGTIFAYGQTSSGKTYTMLGDDKDPGIMVLTAKEIFKEIELTENRQFLLRVGYIEIYNEKIFDLLKKSNQDLKIHETNNGEVNVNCAEVIITSEEKMMECLQAGSKLRKIGETNMNERSSRSHAIFRIIIESQELNMSADEGPVQISILNLVDLAGSERADQTGATGYRLIEGAHINKSLLALSCVIHKLSENESSSYVNYRDSKLTRILQASLGGNALTAIICNINPTATEETNSTLSFAMRAKSIKNKPHVNQGLSDAALMKRLKKEIARLESELEIEKTKNSQIKVLELEQQIHDEELKIVYSHARDSKRNILRRRTWSACVNTEPPTKEKSEGEVTIKKRIPKLTTPLITTRNPLPPLEEFKSLNDISLGRFSIEDCKDIMKTPEVFKNRLQIGAFTPKIDDKLRRELAERELEELKAFTNLENKLDVDHEIIPSLQFKLEQAQMQIKQQENEKIDFLKMQMEWKSTEECLKLRCSDLETEIEKNKNALENFHMREKDYVNDLQTSKQKIKDLEMELSEKNSLEFQQEQHKKIAKQRVDELLEALSEKDQVIKSLNEQICFERNIKSGTCGQKYTIESHNFIGDSQKEGSLNIEKLTKDCEQYKEEVQKLSKKITEMKEESEKFMNEYDLLSTQMMEALQDSENLKKQNDELQIEIKELKKITISSTNPSESNKSVNNVEKDKVDEMLNTTISKKLSATFICPKQPDQNVGDKVINSESEAEKCAKEHEILKEQSHQLEQEKSSVTNAQTTLESLEIIDDSLERFRQHSFPLDQINNLKYLQEAIIACKEENKSLNEQICSLKLKMKELEDENNVHLSEISSLKSDLSAKVNEMTKLNNELSKLLHIKEECQLRLHNLEPLKARNDILTTEVEQIRVQITKQLSTIENLNKQISFLQGEVNKKRVLNVTKQSPISVTANNTELEFSQEGYINSCQRDIAVQVCEEDSIVLIEPNILNRMLQDISAIEIIFEGRSFTLQTKEYNSEMSKHPPVRIEILKCFEKSIMSSSHSYEDDVENFTNQNLNIKVSKDEHENEKRYLTMKFVLFKNHEEKTTDEKWESTVDETKSIRESDANKSTFSTKRSHDLIRNLTEGLDIQLSNKLSGILNRIHTLDKKIENFENNGQLLKEVLEKNHLTGSNCNNLITDHKEIMQQITKLQSVVIEKLAEMNFVTAKFDEKLKNLEKIRDMLKVQFRKYQHQIEKLIEKVNVTKKVNDDITITCDTVNSLNEKLENELHLKDSELNQLKINLETKDSLNGSLKQENDSLILKLNQMQRETLKNMEINQNVSNQVEVFVQTDDTLNEFDTKIDKEHLMSEVESLKHTMKHLQDTIDKGEADKQKQIEKYNIEIEEKQQVSADKSSLIIQNEELKTQVNNLLDLKSNLLKEVDKLNDKINVLNLENENLRGEVIFFKSDYAFMKTRGEDLNSRLKIVNENNIDLTNKLREQKNDIEQLKEANSLLIVESGKLKLQITDEKSYSKTLANKLDKLHNTSETLLQKMQQYESNAENSIREKNKLNEQLEKSLEQNQSLLNEIKGLKELKNELEKNYDRCMNDNANLEKVVKESNYLIKQLEDECKALKLSTSSLADNISKLQQERDSLLFEKETFEKEIINSKHQEEIKLMEHKLTTLKEENIQNLQRLESLEEDYCKVKNICEEKNTYCMSLEEEIEKLKQHGEENEIKNKELSSRNAELLSKMKALEEQNQRHAENLAKIEVKMSQLISENSILQEENQDLLKFKSTTHTLKTVIEEKTNIINSLNNNIKSNLEISNDKISNLELKLNNRNKEYSELEAKLHIITANNTKCSQLLANTIKSLETTQKQLTVECIERQKCQDKVEELSKDFEKLKTEYDACLLQLSDYKKSYLGVDIENDGQGDSKTNLSPNKDLLKQLHEMQKMHLYKTRKLQDQIVCLQAKNTELQQISKSTNCITQNLRVVNIKEQRFGQRVKDLKDVNSEEMKHQQIIENLLGEKKQLEIKNEKLVAELAATRKLANQDRKSRRRSTHDEKRQSLWDFNRDIGTMTEPTDKSCSCQELDLKVNELKKSLRIKECQVNNLFSELKTNPYKDENEMLKKLISEEELAGKKLRIEISKLKQKLCDQINEKRECLQCILNSKRTYIHGETQTEEHAFDFSNEIAKLQTKCDDLKKICRLRKEKIEELQSCLNKEKENEVDNKQNDSKKILASELQNYEKQFMSLKAEYDVLKKKYEQCKIICCSRRDRIRMLEEKLKTLEE